MASVGVAAGTSANAQHNLLALQTQLQSLQRENATLTSALTLRENSLLLKEQQLRVLQQRLDELENGVARWKNRYLQQLQANASSTSPSTPSPPTEWTPVVLPPATRGAALPDADAMGGLVDKLSTADRDKLKKLLGAERARTQLAPWEEKFEDCSRELQRVLLQYLMPVLLETQRLAYARGEQPMVVQCLTRQYTKQTTDVRIVCQRTPPPSATSLSSTTTGSGQEDASEDGSARSASAVLGSVEATASSSHRGSYGSESSTTASTPPPLTASISSSAMGSASVSSASASTSAAVDVHLFDCVDCEVAKRNVSAATVPHGPREIHPTKAVYISRPLTPPTSDGARRFTTLPFKSDSYNDLDRDRGSAASANNSLTGSAPSRDAGKIKKIMGSVMKGLNRHKPSSYSSSSSTPQPTPTPFPPTPTTYNSADTEADDGHDHDASICDGCGRGLLTGVKWVCRSCRLYKDHEYALCEKCYGQGLHGKENEDALFERIEEIVVAKCPKLAREQELMKLLRVGICKANLKKYSFCLTWIADLLLCKATKDLRARALEISQISPQVRSEFVRLLTELLTKHRRDIELITEWQPVQNVAASGSGSGNGGGGGGGGGEGEDGSGMLQLDTLRIWVKDAVVGTL